jgi:nifR3 family TIM-barrel protein
MVSSPAVAGALTIGPITVDVPVVLAPMAGITNTAFRRLCREYGAGLYVSEMITSRALVERTPASMRLIKHHESETTRSIQLYGVDPKTVGDAARMLSAEGLADHIDLNFGCPVPKVTRKGGGAALPWKTDLFQDIVESAVAGAGELPVTVKMRKGIDSEHLTFIEAAKIAQGAGVASIALHARTASEYYSGHADWNAIGELKSTITDVPILGNGDIWSGDDAVRMMDQTDCDGVVVGRGCLGRPWLFADLNAALNERAGVESSKTRVQPDLGYVAQAIRRHAELLVEFFDSEERACRDVRKHMA